MTETDIMRQVCRVTYSIYFQIKFRALELSPYPGEFTPHEWDVLAFSPKKHDGGSNKDFSKTIYSMRMKPT